MSTSRPLLRQAPRARAGLPVALLAALLVAAGCGGSASPATPTPVPTIALATAAPSAAPTDATTATPTDTPTEAAPTEAPASPAVEASADPSRPEAGTFLYGYEDLLAYYTSQAYVCGEPGRSAVAAGYTTHICTLEADGAPTAVVGFLVADDGTLGDIFAGSLNAPGGSAPEPLDMIEPLAFILGATLGEADGTEAATWLAENLGSEMAKTTINGNIVRTYTVDDASGVGAYSEVSTPDYEAAPAP